jgi:REP element-mobilizing transposase RayT
LHHITSRGNNRRSMYEDLTDRERFYGILDRALRRRAEIECHADVLMGNHYHLLLGGPIEVVSSLMWEVNYRYALAYNARHGRINHLLGARFWSTPIPDDRGARAVAIYIALNPVRSDFCHEPSDWEHGSYRAFTGAAQPRPHLSMTLVRGLFTPGTTFETACDNAVARAYGGRPDLAAILPPPDELTRAHVRHACRIFGYRVPEIAAYYGVSQSTFARWLAE